MDRKLSRRRCFVLILHFLLADTLNTDLSGAGALGWLFCLPAALAALPVYRACRAFSGWIRRQNRCGIGKLWDSLLLVFAAGVLFRMTADFGSILRTYNDFTLSPGMLCFMLLGVAFYLSRLHGEGLARTAEMLFWPAAAIWFWTFAVGLADCDFGRLLPLLGQGQARGILWLLMRVFLQGILAQAVLEPMTESAALRTAMRDGVLAAGIVLGLFLAKDIAQIGWNMASRFTYPLYALAGLSRNGSGMHIEDLLICALLAARLIKGAMLFKLIGSILHRWKTIDRLCP